MQREDDDLPEFAVPDPSHLTHFFNHLLDDSHPERPIFPNDSRVPSKEDEHPDPSEHSDEPNPEFNLRSIEVRLSISRNRT